MRISSKLTNKVHNKHSLRLMTHRIIGTAGHIDHGKTALVKALTGIDTDRLKEEKEREITIDLGFAYLDDSIAFIDVPGHEKFVKNMVAGVTGVDLALLVVAADDGIMPQTREHLDIIRLLKVERIVVAITKIDLIDPGQQDWIDLVKDEIESMLTQYEFKKSAIMHVSSVSGAGVEELKSKLKEEIDALPHEKEKQNLPFRLPVDRSFTLTGFGTVVTGTVISGVLKPDDSIELLPQQRELRLRSMQRHNKKVTQVNPGERAAINLGGIQKNEIVRGDVIARSEFFIPSQTINCSLHYLDSAKVPLKFRDRVRFHTGTIEVIGRVILLEKDILRPGEKTVLQIQLEKPVTVAVGDRFIIRKYSPAVTIGGGTVLEIDAKRPRRNRKQIAEYLKSVENLPRQEQVCSFVIKNELHPHSTQKIAAQFGLFHNQVSEILISADDRIMSLNREEETPVSSDKLWISRKSFESFTGKILEILRKFHNENPEKPALDRLKLIKKSGYTLDEPVWNFAFEQMTVDSRIVLSKNRVKLADFIPEVSGKYQELRRNIVEHLKQTGAAGPSQEEFADTLKVNIDDVKTVITLLVDEGDVIIVGNSFLYAADEIMRIESLIRDSIKQKGSITISEFRTSLNTSRKYALPLLNYFDDTGVTVRVGDERILK